jgi:hypothetical protein
VLIKELVGEEVNMKAQLAMQMRLEMQSRCSSCSSCRCCCYSRFKKNKKLVRSEIDNNNIYAF